MESNSKENRILCSEKSLRLLREQAPGFYTKRRGQISVKGKGDMLVYWVGDTLINARKGRKERQVGFDLAGEDPSNYSHSEVDLMECAPTLAARQLVPAQAAGVVDEDCAP